MIRALAALAAGLVVGLGSGCASLPAPPPDEASAAAGAPATASSPAPSASPLRVSVQAPQALRLLLERYLDVARLPELARGGTLQLRVASARLRDAGLLSRSGSSTRLFGQYPDRFELLPDGDDLVEGQRLISWDVEPGDVLAFHYRTLHGAPGNSLSHRRRGVGEVDAGLQGERVSPR